MRGLSEIIDKGTCAKQPYIYLSSTSQCASGYVVFVVNGKLVQRAINAYKANMPGYVIVYKKETIEIDVPLKPISGAFNVESLKVYG
jgi:hypothetical protein